MKLISSNRSPQAQALIFALAICLLIASACAQDNQPFSINKSPLPNPTSPVMDYAGVLNPEVQKSLARKLIKFRDESVPSVEIAVAIVKTTDGRPIFEYSLAVARGWGIGSREDDNPSALLFIAVDDRKYFTHVSRNLEDELPDGLVGSLQREYLVPEFKNANYGKGIEDTIDAYLQTINERQNRGFNTSDTPKTVSIPKAVSRLTKSKHFVNDIYGILDTPVKTVMERRLIEFGASMDPRVSIYIVIIETTDNAPIRAYAAVLAREWGIDQNNNLLLLIAMKDRKSFAYVSPGLRSTLPANRVENIQNRHLRYAFSPYSGAYNQAISNTVNGFILAIDPGQPRVDFTKGNPDGFRRYDSIFHYIIDSWLAIIVGIIILLVVAFFIWGIISSIFDAVTGKGSSYGSSGSPFSGGWSSGSSSSSSWTSSSSSSSSSDWGNFGGGGDFGGGGAGGSW